MNRKEIIGRIRRSVLGKAPGAKIILFGSEARGDATASSDIDILILLNKENISNNDKATITDLLYEIELETGVLISPLIYTFQQWENRPFLTPFYINVVNEGIAL